MYLVGLDVDTRAYFTAATMIIALPTGIKIFSWIATIYGGQPHYYVPFTYTLVFIMLFTIGGQTGVIQSNSSQDVAQHDTEFIYIEKNMLTKERSIEQFFIGPNKRYIEQFFIGLFEGDGTLTVDWYRNKPRVRAVIALKNEQSNVEMLNIIKNVVGGRVVKQRKKTKEYIVWICDNKKNIESQFLLFEKYPFITFKRRMEFSFAKRIYSTTDKSLFQIDRKNKYANKELIRSQSKPQYPPYFKSWLSGFIEAEGNFSLNDAGKLRKSSFNIGQQDEIEMLNLIKIYFKSNRKILTDKKIYKNGLFYNRFEMSNEESRNRLMEHFTHYPLQGYKKDQWKIFINHHINKLELWSHSVKFLQVVEPWNGSFSFQRNLN